MEKHSIEREKSHRKFGYQMSDIIFDYDLCGDPYASIAFDFIKDNSIDLMERVEFEIPLNRNYPEEKDRILKTKGYTIDHFVKSIFKAYNHGYFNAKYGHHFYLLILEYLPFDVFNSASMHEIIDLLPKNTDFLKCLDEFVRRNKAVLPFVPDDQCETIKKTYENLLQEYIECLFAQNNTSNQ